MCLWGLLQCRFKFGPGRGSKGADLNPLPRRGRVAGRHRFHGLRRGRLRWLCH